MIKLVTDSTCYLPSDTVEKFDLRIVPLNVHFGEEQTFQEGVTLDNDQFYTMLAEAPISEPLPPIAEPTERQ